MKRTSTGMGPQQGFKAENRKRAPTSLAGYDRVQYPNRPQANPKAYADAIRATAQAKDAEKSASEQIGRMEYERMMLDLKMRKADRKARKAKRR